MTSKLTGKKKYKKYIVVIYLLIIGNLAQGAVLCFGADGHIELESAFHKRCDEPVHYHASDRNQHSHKAGHEKGKHCKPCIDVPISIGLVKISQVPKDSNPTFPVPASNVVVHTDKLNFSVCNLISNTFVGTSYFIPLRTVILLA